ncbi:hypothetical protein GCM10023405_33540 [Streptomonospora salina]
MQFHRLPSFCACVRGRASAPEVVSAIDFRKADPDGNPPPLRISAAQFTRRRTGDAAPTPFDQDGKRRHPSRCRHTTHPGAIAECAPNIVRHRDGACAPVTAIAATAGILIH